MSADVILIEFNNLRELSQSMPGVRVKKLAYFHSFMLLTGLAFENLIKGILIGRCKTIVNQESIDTSHWGGKSGHGIEELARKVTSISSDESNLLKRLQESLIWGGRYPIPKTSGVYFANRDLLSLLPTDFVLINNLFLRLEGILTSEWEKRSETESRF